MNFIYELYKQVILDHNRKPQNFRTLGDKRTHSCEGKNPLCGDEYIVEIKLNENFIEDLVFSGTGCAISKASASMMTTQLIGKNISEAKSIFEEFQQMIIGKLDPNKDEHNLGKLIIFKGVKDFASRTKCASLCWHTLICAINKEKKITTE